LADLAAAGVEIEKTDEIGDRDLAYEINKRTRGRYVLFTVNAAPTAIERVDRAFKLNTNLFRHLFVRKDD
ncbi:MAG: 30S ribosomal protein S6, partial [Spirochaetaceae bacterium]|nr:30S ribosomal protein S6 [Spirochaetaceae bacterium]